MNIYHCSVIEDEEGNEEERNLKRKLTALILVLTVLMSTGLTGCAKKTETAATKEPQEMTLNLYQENATLDWQKASATGEIQIYNWIMEGLTRSAGNGTVKPGIAEKWEVSPDGLVWTFHLRDAKWSDGKPVVAENFAYGAFRAIDPKEPKDYAYFLFDIVGAEDYSAGKATKEQVGIKAIDEKTIQYTLKQPVSYFDYLGAFITYAPVRQDIVERDGQKYNTEADLFVTNGPFKVATWNHNAEMTFVKNPEYWDAASIKLDKIIGVMITEDSTEFNMYEAGEIDTVIALDSEMKAAMTKGKVEKYSDGSVWFFDFNCTDPILKNRNIRKALTYAIDRKSFIENVAKTPWVPAMAFVQPDIIPDADGKPFREKKPAYFTDNNVEAAKEYLAKGMEELGLTKLPKLKLLSNDASKAQMYAQAFQEMWKKNLGVDSEVEPVPSAQRIERQQAHDYQISLGGWGPDYPDPMSDLDLYITGAGNNDPAYSNPEYDALLKAAKVEPDKVKKFEMMHKAEDILMEDMPIGPLYYRYRDYAVREYVKGYTRDSFAPDMNPVYAWIEGKPAKK